MAGDWVEPGAERLGLSDNAASVARMTLLQCKPFRVGLDVERLYEDVHLVALEISNVERFALEHEHGLIVHIAAARD